MYESKFFQFVCKGKFIFLKNKFFGSCSPVFLKNVVVNDNALALMEPVSFARYKQR